MTERKYLPTLADLLDRLSIVLLKQIFIAENRDAYVEERKLIEHDLDLMLPTGTTAVDVKAIMMLAIANRFIWENEAKARQGGSEQDKLLKITHAVNGVRNYAKNLIAQSTGERKELKANCLADFGPQTADLGVFGNWNVFDE